MSQDRWCLEDIYESKQQWEEDINRLETLLQDVAGFQGKLDTSGDSFYSVLDLESRIQELIVKIYSYARMKRDEDNTDSSAQSLFGRGVSLFTKVETALSFITPEILALPEDTIASFQQDPRFADYSHYLHDLLRQKPHTLSGELEQLVAQTGEIGRTQDEIFKMLNNADITFPTIIDEEGEEVEITKGNFINLMQKKDRRVRADAFKALYKTYSSLENTFAAALNAGVKRDIFYAQIRKHPSSLTSSLYADKVPTDVYDNLIETVRANLGEMHRYLELRKRILGVEELHMYDIYVPLAYAPWEVSYPEAVEMVKEGVAVLGDSYGEILAKGLESGWIDIYERKGKTGGAYCDSIYGLHPFLLLNHQSNLDSAFTLAHELGHALHFYYSAMKQPFIYAHPAIFTAEVASTVHESLVMEHLLESITEPDKRLYLINYYLEIFRGTLFRQTMFAEFEKVIHEQGEAGEVLTSQYLREIYGDLNSAYHGEGVVADEEISMEWARIPHFYNAFYVYKYATGISAATSLVKQMLSQGKPAVDRYLSFLQTGSSDYPLTLLKEAGVDMAEPQPIQDAIDRFSGLVDELERLVDANI